MNTYEKGVLTIISYPTQEKTWVFACSEFSIVIEDKDREMAELRLLKNAKRYLENVCEMKLGEHLLNLSLQEDILKEFNEYRIKKTNEDFEKIRLTFEGLFKLLHEHRTKKLEA